MPRVYIGRSEVSRVAAQEEFVLGNVTDIFIVFENKESLTGFSAWHPSIGCISGFELEALFRRKRFLKTR